MMRIRMQIRGGKTDARSGAGAVLVTNEAQKHTDLDPNGDLDPQHLKNLTYQFRFC
jgi:hypothetical protein